MPAIDTLHTLLVEELRDIYDAENQLVKALPKLAAAISNDELKLAVQSHLEQTKTHVTRLQEAFDHLDENASGKACAGMKGLIQENDEHAGEEYEDPGLRDAAIIGGAQRIEHYEIAAYGTALAHARLLALDDVAELLESTLEEEKETDDRLTEIAEEVVNLEAAGEDEDEESEEQPSRR